MRPRFFRGLSWCAAAFFWGWRKQNATGKKLQHDHLDGIWDANILTQPMVQTMRTALAGKAVCSQSIFVKGEFRGGPIFPGSPASLKSCFKPGS